MKKGGDQGHAGMEFSPQSRQILNKNGDGIPFEDTPGDLNGVPLPTERCGCI